MLLTNTTTTAEIHSCTLLKYSSELMILLPESGDTAMRTVCDKYPLVGKLINKQSQHNFHNEFARSTPALPNQDSHLQNILDNRIRRMY